RQAAGEGPRVAVRRDVLAHSLFGVDLKLTAVRLAELRLWLALVADDEEADLERIAPLPNLDGHVRQGDALLDPLALARSAAGGDSTPRGGRCSVACERAGARSATRSAGSLRRVARRFSRSSPISVTSSPGAGVVAGAEAASTWSWETRRGCAASGCPRRCGKPSPSVMRPGAPRASAASRISPISPSRSWSGRWSW